MEILRLSAYQLIHHSRVPASAVVDDAVAFVRQFVQSGKPVAAICHAPWTLVEADVVRGRTVTSWPSLQTDLRNAGAEWVDEQVVVDTSGGSTLITAIITVRDRGLPGGTGGAYAAAGCTVVPPG